MTMPLERTRAVLHTKQFLEELLNPQKTPRISPSIRRCARALLRHYPDAGDIHRASIWAADVFGPVPERPLGSSAVNVIDFTFTLKYHQTDDSCSQDELIEHLGATGFTDVLVGLSKPGILALQLTCAADSAQDALFGTMQAFTKSCPTATLIEVIEHIVRVG